MRRVFRRLDSSSNDNDFESDGGGGGRGCVPTLPFLEALASDEEVGRVMAHWLGASAFPSCVSPCVCLCLHCGF